MHSREGPRPRGPGRPWRCVNWWDAGWWDADAGAGVPPVRQIHNSTPNNQFPILRGSRGRARGLAGRVGPGAV